MLRLVLELFVSESKLNIERWVSDMKRYAIPPVIYVLRKKTSKNSFICFFIYLLILFICS